MSETRSPEPEKLQAFVGQVLGDLGAATSAILVRIGDRLGLYKAMAGAGPLTSAELAERTGTDERYVREWLANQAASGYVQHHAGSDRFELTPEQAAVFADESSPAFQQGGFEGLPGLHARIDHYVEAFRTGRGVAWHEQHPSFFPAVERLFRPTYQSSLVQEWIPALEGIPEKLERGGSVADVGCGFGASTLLIGEAYPNARCTGYDYHAESVEAARERAKEAGLDGRVRFERAGAKEIPTEGFDLVAFFDCLHDMGDPVGAAERARQCLAPDGAVMLVEPLAGDRVEENLNPVGRLYYAFSTICCTPASRAQEVGLGLGAQAGEARLREVLAKAGFTRIRRAAETPLNMVIEARP